MKIKDEKFYKAVKDFLETYLIKQKGYSHNTQRAYKLMFSQLLDYFNEELSIPYHNVGFDNLTYANICGFLAWLENSRKSAAQTINQRLMAIRSFTKYASIIDPAKIYIQADISNVPCKKEPIKVVQHLSEDAIKILFEQPNTTKPNGRRDQFFMHLMYDSAARCQELLELKVKDVSLGKNSSVTLTRKGGKRQSIPLSDETSARFEEYMKCFHHELCAEDFVFYTIIHGTRQQMSPDAVAVFIKKYAAQGRASCSELPLRVHPHLFRHSRAMHLYRSGMPLVLISEFLGHSDVNTTRIYAWSDTEMKRQALKKVAPKSESTVQPIWDGDENMIKKLYGII
jgi:site-specific recombinase XerD